MAPEKIDTLITSLTTDYKKAEVDQKERAALDYAAKLTKAPGDITQKDVKTLKSHGFNDRAIHDVCAVTAYFAFVNRIADGLGVELEKRFD